VTIVIPADPPGRNVTRYQRRESSWMMQLGEEVRSEATSRRLLVMWGWRHVAFAVASPKPSFLPGKDYEVAAHTTEIKGAVQSRNH